MTTIRTRRYLLVPAGRSATVQLSSFFDETLHSIIISTGMSYGVLRSSEQKLRDIVTYPLPHLETGLTNLPTLTSFGT